MLIVVCLNRLYCYCMQSIRRTDTRTELARPRWPHVVSVALLVCLLAGGLIAPVQAQAHLTQYVATVWQTEQGLPNNSVNAMVQDHEGYLWLATNAGLARFDGVRFRIFGGDDFPSLISSRFQSIHVSRSGALWIGTRNGGLIRLQNGTTTTYLERDGLPSRNVRSIREDTEGRLWINTINGTACWTGEKLLAYSNHRGRAIGEFLLQARDGSMWFRSGMDVLRFGTDGSFSTLAGAFAAEEARDGSVWIAFEHQYRLVRYAHGVFSDVPLPAAGVRLWTGSDPLQGVAMAGDPRQAVLAMAKDTDGELLLLLPSGLVRVVDGKLSQPEALQPPANIGGMLKVLSLLVDREGNRWVGTVGRGLFRFRRAPLTAYGRDEGLSDSPFRATFQDREGRIWLGGDDGLYWFDGRQFHLVPGLKEIGAIAQTKDGDLWFGGSGAVYRRRSGVLTRFRIESPSVFQILQDREGTVWVVAPNNQHLWRLCRFRDGAFEQVDTDVVHMTEDREGGLWLAGVYPPALRLVRGNKTVRYDATHGMPHNGVHSFYQEPSGILWFSTTTGLYRLRDGKFGSITAKNGLTTEITSILNDGKGNLWLPSEHGIFRLSLTEVNEIADGKVSSMPPVSYGVAEGMKSTECNGGIPGSWKAQDGRLWFPTMRGVVAIDPDAINGPPAVILEEAWANKVKLGAESRTSVKAGNDTFNFTFTALSLSAPEKQRFKYRLEPYDKEWVDAETRRTAHYTNMPPGEYSFKVIAANSFGVWNNQGAGVHFVLQPHFYQTNWFRFFCAVVVVALLWAAYEFRVRQLQRDFKKLNEVIESIPAMAWTALPDGSNDFANKRWVEYTGLSAEDTAGSGWMAAVHPEDIQLYGEKWRAAIATGEPFDIEARFRCAANKEYRWLLARGVPLRDEHGKILRWYGILTDVEDRKRAEGALRQSETYLAEAQKLSHTGSWALDLASDRYDYVSDEDLRIFGFDPQESSPTREAVFRRIHPEDRNRVVESFQDTLRQKIDSSNEYRIVLPDGTVRHIYTTRHPVLNSEGNVVRLFGTSADITERKRSEEMLHDSETRFRMLIENVADAILVQDEQGIIVDVNPQGCEALGYSRPEVVGKTPFDSFCLNTDREGTSMERVAERIAMGETLLDRHWHRRKDGTVFPVEVHTSQFDYGGRRFLLKAVRDISESMRAEEAVRKSEKQLRDVIDTIPAYVWSALPNGSVEFINRRILEYSGFSFDQAIGNGWQAAIHPEDRDHYLEVQQEAIASGQAFEVEARLRRADGQYRWLLFRSVPLYDEAGNIIKRYGVSTDIDDRKRAEQALRRSEAYLADAQRLTHTGAWASDETTQPLYWSEEVFRIFGFDPQQELPTLDQRLQRIHPEDFDIFWQGFQKTIRDKVDSEGEFRIVLPDGTVRYAHALSHPVLSANGDFLESVGSIVDITEHKLAEQEHERLRQLEAELAHIDRVSMLGELSASIAHEVNQPLAGVVSNGSACLRWLAGEVPNLDEAREAARRIIRDGKRAAEVIARIRALAKRADTPKEKLNLNETVHEVLAIVGGQAKRNNIVIRTQFAPDLSPVLGDRVQLQQVVLNLVMNGIEAMNSVTDRQRELVISTLNIDADQVQATVKDSGMGLDPDKINKVFDSFYTTKSSGMGMGLSISRSILQAHQGRLWATANDGPGASFHFTLPRYQLGQTNAAV